MPKIIELYCEECEKETKHRRKFSFVKSFLDGAFMGYTKGWSLMNDTCLFQCQECGNIVEVEVEN